MCDLSPIELVWAKIKRNVRIQHQRRSEPAKITTNDKNTVAHVTKEDWEGFLDT
jgi:transposase